MKVSGRVPTRQSQDANEELDSAVIPYRELGVVLGRRYGHSFADIAAGEALLGRCDGSVMRWWTLRSVPFGVAAAPELYDGRHATCAPVRRWLPQGTSRRMAGKRAVALQSAT